MREHFDFQLNTNTLAIPAKIYSIEPTQNRPSCVVHDPRLYIGSL